jgi:L-2,4-diaminobutyric acid acetyltransferase
MASPNPAREPTCRPPTPKDAAAVWRLVRDSGALDLNSPYAYLLVCSHFARTSRVAEEEGRLLAFVAGHRRPDVPDAFFVWQVGTAAEARGRGLAKRLILELVAAEQGLGARWLDATVTPSNAASAALFRSVARALGVPCAESVAYPSTLFPEPGHEDEVLFRIGPFPDISISDRRPER